MDLTLLDTLKTIHVVAAVLWVGGGFALNVGITLAFRSRDATYESNMLKTAEFIGQRIFLPLSLVVLATGIWMVLEFDPLFQFKDFWISYGIAGIIATSLTGSLFLGPRAGKLAGQIEAGTAQDQVQSTASKLLIVARIDLLVLISVVCIMVIRP
jgi:uncharacterized membrane protein